MRGNLVLKNGVLLEACERLQPRGGKTDDFGFPEPRNGGSVRLAVFFCAQI
jgi:hypothetical protein